MNVFNTGLKTTWAPFIICNIPFSDLISDIEESHFLLKYIMIQLPDMDDQTGLGPTSTTPRSYPIGKLDYTPRAVESIGLQRADRVRYMAQVEIEILSEVSYGTDRLELKL